MLLSLSGAAWAQSSSDLLSVMQQQQQQQQQTQQQPQGATVAPVAAVPATPAAADKSALPPQGEQLPGNGQPTSEQPLVAGMRGIGAAESGFGLTQRPPPPPGEFEKYVEGVIGRKLPRFGSSLLLPASRDFTIPATTTVPPDYRINPGDQLMINLAGSIEDNLQATVDNDGRIFIPRVGAVMVAGVRYADLPDLLRTQVGTQARDFRLSVSISRLHGIRYYVTGFANNPGAYSSGSLSTLVNGVLAAGGPASGGSFRTIELRRGGALISSFDLYDLLLHGDKSKDILLQNDDVIYIAPVGPQVAMTGSINSEAIYEAKPGEALADLMRDVGGLSTLADPSRVLVSRLSDLDKTGWVQLDLAQSLPSPVRGGDILRILSLTDFLRPAERQGILVKIEGEIDKPGNYFLPPGSTVRDLMALAGSTTQRAYLFGTELDRVSVQRQQEKSFDEAIGQLELDISASPLVNNHVEAADLVTAHAVVDQLRSRKPDGRVVLDLPPDATGLALDMPLENNDRIYIPPQPTTVGVFGAVFRPGSFQLRKLERVADYLALAGGPQNIAEESQIFVVRANGEVIPAENGALRAPALPGDIIFVPTRTHPSTLLEDIKDVTSILFQFSLGAAAIAALTK